MARGLKFRIKEVEGLYYPCSENKDADQLRGHREADLRPCFRIGKKLVFSTRSSITSFGEKRADVSAIVYSFLLLSFCSKEFLEFLFLVLPFHYFNPKVKKSE